MSTCRRESMRGKIDELNMSISNFNHITHHHHRLFLFFPSTMILSSPSLRRCSFPAPASIRILTSSCAGTKQEPLANSIRPPQHPTSDTAITSRCYGQLWIRKALCGPLWTRTSHREPYVFSSVNSQFVFAQWCSSPGAKREKNHTQS